MHLTKRFFAAALAAAAAALAPVAAGACTLQPVDKIRIKQMMADEIAHRLGLERGKFPINAITEPQLHRPYALDSLCTGLGALHHSAGFRHAQVWRIGPGPLPPTFWPQPALPAHGERAAQRDTAQPAARPAGVEGWPPYASCAYEGVAVVLGYAYSSPVAVHFERCCN